LEADPRWMGITLAGVVHSDHEAIGIRDLRGDGAAEIGGKSSDAALARQVIAEDRDSTNRCRDGSVVHDSPHQRRTPEQIHPLIICIPSQIATSTTSSTKNKLN